MNTIEFDVPQLYALENCYNLDLLKSEMARIDPTFHFDINTTLGGGMTFAAAGGAEEVRFYHARFKVLRVNKETEARLRNEDTEGEDLSFGARGWGVGSVATV